MSNELFSEVCEEQQQLVAGGKSIYDYINTNYYQDLTAFNFSIGSGPNGSYVNQQFAELEIDTSAYKDFYLDSYDPYIAY
ncbi:MAG: CTB family bacteriocin [Fischerella sp. CENA71]|nr:CTB family bacteriocin [Fischerella sp. CENA71]